MRLTVDPLKAVYSPGLTRELKAALPELEGILYNPITGTLIVSKLDGSEFAPDDQLTIQTVVKAHQGIPPPAEMSIEARVRRLEKKLGMD